MYKPLVVLVRLQAVKTLFGLVANFKFYPHILNYYLLIGSYLYITLREPKLLPTRPHRAAR